MAFDATSRQRQREDGAAAVEFVLVVPILLTLVFGIINWGLIFTTQISLNSAARDSARAGVVQPLGGAGLTCADIANLARNQGKTLGTGSIGVTVSGPSYSCSLPAGQTTVGGDASETPCSSVDSVSNPQLTVQLTYDYKSPVPIVPPYAWTMTSTGQFLCEYS